MVHRPKQLSVLVGILVALALLLPTGAVKAQDDAGLLLPLDNPYAPFLESRAFAAAQGATNEFRKMEWVALDSVNNRVYWAMSEVAKGMTDGEGAVNVEENLCGIVYAGDLDAEYNITSIYPYIVGGPYNSDDEANPCDVNNIANPDNLFVDPQGNLWIGEDTSNHANNVLWMYDGETLHRFGTVPTGAETTGVFVTEEGTVFFNVQHPSGTNPHPFNRGLVGVVTGFKTGDAFEAMAAPEGSDQKQVKVAAGKYQILARAGELIPGDVMGQRYGQLVTVDGEMMGVCNQPDANMFLPTVDDGSEGYLYTNFECEPGAVSRAYIRNNGESWDVLEGENVDFASVMGTWINCGGGVSPWNTALTAEEYEPIAAADSWADSVASMSEYLGAQANPYDYGYIVEMMPDPDGDGVESIVEKRYAMGRFSHENAVVMPDGKTVYHGDDGTDVVFFKFVADEAGDLSAGTLSAAKVTQSDDGSFGFEWIELGHGSDDEIAEAIRLMELP
jgi:secreted PhoX family phosphatase